MKQQACDPKNATTGAVMVAGTTQLVIDGTLRSGVFLGGFALRAFVALQKDIDLNLARFKHLDSRRCLPPIVLRMQPACFHSEGAQMPRNSPTPARQGERIREEGSKIRKSAARALVGKNYFLQHDEKCINTTVSGAV